MEEYLKVIAYFIIATFVGVLLFNNINTYSYMYGILVGAIIAYIK